MPSRRAVAIIPARMGSKRLPNKNLRLLHGKPLIAWTIEAALQSGCFDRIIVSTDATAIQEVATQYGADAPFLRPEHLANDHASSYSVLEHSLLWLQEQAHETYEIVTLLQPTSPLRRTQDIQNAFALFKEKTPDFVISVTACEHNPLWANTLPLDHVMDHFLNPAIEGMRSQDLPAYYRLNGAIYMGLIKSVLEYRGFSSSRGKAYAYIMEPEHSVDIDHLIDFKFAEVLLAE